MARLRYIMLLQRDVPRAAKFYSEGLGLTVNVCSDRWAELQSGDMKLALKQVDSEAHCTTGYSPFLHFDVDDLDGTVQRLLSLGAFLDGPIKYPTHGKVAAMRGPDGHMLGLHEPALSS
ncbi:hypothetical protein KFL_002260190 [Klebsormidium nitens]|uniref:VOC domain-containing protein n=1 Tax=Klebsormidium nitens TaxID=105231 RepID=A0A1Y1I448_KLENI|nr:hypothetical protein KFL_002260190 [Klebsormidium nitens]|eukprot:GAQ85263.1 hypothetical protein KFL_002260190 [Klebsormidium nitens]